MDNIDVFITDFKHYLIPTIVVIYQSPYISIDNWDHSHNIRYHIEKARAIYSAAISMDLLT